MFHAVWFFTMSSHVTTPVTSIRLITTSAAVVAFIQLPPKIHSASAMTTSAASVISRRVRLPIFASSPAAHFGTSSPSFTSGGYSQYVTSGIRMSSAMPTGANATNHCVHVRLTPAVLLTSSTASRLGASAVRNSELVTHVVASATHIRYDPMRRADGSSGLLS